MTDLDATAARAAIVRVMELLEDAADAGHTTVSIENVREMLTNREPGRLYPGMLVRLPAEVLHEIPQGVVLGLLCGQCVVVPAEASATKAEIIPWSAA